MGSCPEILNAESKKMKIVLEHFCLLMLLDCSMTVAQIQSRGAGCSCNGYTHNGLGGRDCRTRYLGCAWCYVGWPNTCKDLRISTTGSPYGGSCQACGNTGGRWKPEGGSGSCPTFEPGAGSSRCSSAQKGLTCGYDHIRCCGKTHTLTYCSCNGEWSCATASFYCPSPCRVNW